MSGSELALAVSVFLACAVEAVEALTIVLAVGHTRSWRSSFAGVGAAIVVLAALTAALGPALTALPINALRVVVGALLLIFGLQWLRKAILRAGGFKALHDEAAAYEHEEKAAREQGAVQQGIDPYSFTISFKGVLLEGLEVVFIVLTFGANQHNVALAAAAAAAHRHYADWTIERIRADAAAIGPSTAKLTALILESRPHPEQGYRACIGILRLAHHYGAVRLEAACSRGLDIGARSYGSIQSILKHGLDGGHRRGLCWKSRLAKFSDNILSPLSNITQ